MSFVPAAAGLIGTLVVAKVATNISKNIGKTSVKRKTSKGGKHKIIKASKPKKTLYGGKSLGATKRKRRAQGKVFSSHDKDPRIFG